MKNTDKISILVAVLIIAGLSYLGFSLMRDAKPQAVTIESLDSGVAKASLPQMQYQSPNELLNYNFNWEEPKSQDSEDPKWIYGIFTPPRIWLDNGEFRVIPPRPGPDIIEPFGLSLVDIGTIYFPVLIQGYSGTARAPLISLAICDTHGKALPNGEMLKRINDIIPNVNVTLVRFSEKLTEQEDGSMKKEEFVLVRDSNGKEVLLKVGEPYDTGIYNISLRTDSGGMLSIQLDKQGLNFLINKIQGSAQMLDPITFLVGEQKYKLVQVDIPAKKITLEKIAAKNKKSEVNVLEMESVTPPSSISGETNGSGSVEEVDAISF